MSVQTCPQCHAEIVGRFHFCLECGAALELAQSLTPIPVQQAESASQPELPAPQEAPVRHLPKRSTATGYECLDLTLIRSPDLDSVRFVVRDQSVIGRSEGNLIFKDDPYICAKHASLYYRDGELYIQDEGSVNGVYLRITESKNLQPGMTFIAGEQLFMIQSHMDQLNHPLIDQLSSASDVHFFANSAPQSSPYFLVQLLEGGGVGSIYPFIDSSITIGRQGCDINAPLDRFMSSKHCHLGLMMDQQITLTDTGSKNGTYLKVDGERKLKVGDYILIGKQLLQVQPHQPGSNSQVAV